MITFLLVVHALIAAALVTVILMQRSEGGGLGMGGSPSGLMTARGAADFLTRATSVLATLFVLMAFLIAALASRRDSAAKIDTSLSGQAAPAPITAPVAPGNAIPGIPMMGGGAAATAPDAATAQALQPATAGLPGANTQPAKPTPEQMKQQADQMKAQAAAERAAAQAQHRALSSLKTIDTSKTSGKASIGINGINGVSRGNAATSSAIKAPAPIATKPATPPTLNIAPPPASSPSNGATPQ